MVFHDIWRSFRAMPLWVQFWIAVLLVPVNAASILFVTQYNGVVITVLAIGGMLPNLWFMFRERGFSKVMAIPHLILWTPLVIGLFLWKSNAPGGIYGMYLIVLLAVDTISLAFDFPDTWRWWRGDRDVAK